MTTATTIDPHVIDDAAKARQFILAGNATFTIRSVKTGTRFTFKVTQGKKGKNPPHFVMFMDQGSFQYMGAIFHDVATNEPNLRSFRTTQRSRYDMGQPYTRAFRFLMEHLAEGKLHDQLELWHEGKCGRCGRQLTVPESLLTGLGPECSANAGVTRAKLPKAPRATKARATKAAKPRASYELPPSMEAEARANLQPAAPEPKMQRLSTLRRRQAAVPAPEPAPAPSHAPFGDDIEAEMHAMERAGDDAQTFRENLAKYLVKGH